MKLSDWFITVRPALQTIVLILLCVLFIATVFCLIWIAVLLEQHGHKYAAMSVVALMVFCVWMVFGKVEP